MSSPSNPRRKVPPREPTASPSPPSIPPLPVEEAEVRDKEEQQTSSGEDNNPANTATDINPEDIPRQPLSSLLMSGIASTSADKHLV